jgi:hypothetical protein
VEWRYSQFHAPAALPQRMSPWYPLDRRLGGPHNWSGRCGEGNNLDTVGNRTRAVQLVAIPTELTGKHVQCLCTDSGPSFDSFVCYPFVYCLSDSLFSYLLFPCLRCGMLPVAHTIQREGLQHCGVTYKINLQGLQPPLQACSAVRIVNARHRRCFLFVSNLSLYDAALMPAIVSEAKRRRGRASSASFQANKRP